MKIKRMLQYFWSESPGFYARVRYIWSLHLFGLDYVSSYKRTNYGKPISSQDKKGRRLFAMPVQKIIAFFCLRCRYFCIKYDVIWIVDNNKEEEVRP
jgi:hypothetical protein